MLSRSTSFARTVGSAEGEGGGEGDASVSGATAHLRELPSHDAGSEDGQQGQGQGAGSSGAQFSSRGSGERTRGTSTTTSIALVELAQSSVIGRGSEVIEVNDEDDDGAGSVYSTATSIHGRQESGQLGPQPPQQFTNMREALAVLMDPDPTCSGAGGGAGGGGDTTARASGGAGSLSVRFRAAHMNEPYSPVIQGGLWMHESSARSSPALHAHQQQQTPQLVLLDMVRREASSKQNRHLGAGQEQAVLCSVYGHMIYRSAMRTIFRCP